MLCREMPDELTSQQASVIRSFRASSTFFRMEPWTRRASNMVAVEFYVCADEKMRKASLRAQVLCCWRDTARDYHFHGTEEFKLEARANSQF